MRYELLATVLCVGCTMETPGGGDDDGGGGGGWTAMPLVDDMSNPNRGVYHQGNDRVTGIYFESADKGFIVSQGMGETAGRGGAVFKASGTSVDKVLFSGDGTGLSLSGSIDFVGLEKTPTGYLALAYANDVITSRDGGATFTIEKNGNLAGIEPVIGYKVSASGTTLVRKTGVVTTSTSAPGTSASYTDVWAPNAVPSIPAQVPATMCKGGPLGTGVPTTRDSVYVSSDRNFIAYTSNPGTFEPQICISTDGGRSFTPRKLTIPEAADDYPPTGVTFTSATNGITWFASSVAGTYLKRTTDGGSTWTDVALPASIASHSMQLPAGFFAPDGQHGWLAGYDLTASASLLLATTDGGATWSTVDVGADDKLFSGFALDATHVWLGGEHGLVLHN
jgi:hypothetical protein